MPPPNYCRGEDAVAKMPMRARRRPVIPGGRPNRGWGMLDGRSDFRDIGGVTEILMWVAMVPFQGLALGARK
jgi:hypothetical protein